MFGIGGAEAVDAVPAFNGGELRITPGSCHCVTETGLTVTVPQVKFASACSVVARTNQKGDTTESPEIGASVINFVVKAPRLAWSFSVHWIRTLGSSVDVSPLLFSSMTTFCVSGSRTRPLAGIFARAATDRVGFTSSWRHSFLKKPS